MNKEILIKISCNNQFKKAMYIRQVKIEVSKNAYFSVD